ncbi:MAG: hypothetical protein WA669_22705 [Pseudolabrys sp.]
MSVATPATGRTPAAPTSEPRMKLTTISRLACLTTALAAGVALMATANVASAKNSHHHGNDAENNGASPHFVISGQPANVKRVLREKKNKDKYAQKKKKGCEKIVVSTAECGVSSKDPVGATHPTLPPSQTTGNKGLSPAFTTVTLSNGVTKSAIFNGNGLTVTAASPTSIMIANSNSAVTMNGESVTLHGAISVQAGPGMQVYRQSNGDVTISIKPKEVVLTGDSIKTSGSDTIAIPKGAVVVRDHRDGKDPGVAIVKNDDGTYSAKATDENKGIIGAAGSAVWDFTKSVAPGFSKPASTSTSVQE